MTGVTYGPGVLLDAATALVGMSRGGLSGAGALALPVFAALHLLLLNPF
jgi:hypothetical protein